jgi:hypothetical protein
MFYWIFQTNFYYNLIIINTLLDYINLIYYSVNT